MCKKNILRYAVQTLIIAAIIVGAVLVVTNSIENSLDSAGVNIPGSWSSRSGG